MPQFRLVFGWSRSPHYQRAAALAATVPAAVVDGAGSERLHRVPITPDSFATVAELVALVAGWKRTTVELDGMPLPDHGGLFALRWVIGCWQERAVTDLGALHCWGLGRFGRGRLPCRVLDRALPQPWPRDLRDPAILTRVIAGRARAQATLCCPAFDLAAVQAAAVDDVGGGDGGGPTPAERARLAQLLDGVDLGGG